MMGMVVKYECDLCGKEIHWDEDGIVLNECTKHGPFNETVKIAVSYTVHLECARRVVQRIGEKRGRKVHDPLTAVNPVLIYDPETGTASKSPFD